MKYSACGSREVIAVIDDKYYCFKCGSRIVRKNVLKQIEGWKSQGLIPDLRAIEINRS